MPGFRGFTRTLKWNGCDLKIPHCYLFSNRETKSLEICLFHLREIKFMRK